MVGNKYIIEIEEAYAPIQRIGTQRDLPLLYRVKGFNSLVFDEEGLNKLEKYDPDKEYDRGYEQGCADTEKENMIRVGDEVQDIRCDNLETGIVTELKGDFVFGYYDATSIFRWPKDCVRKTGKHFPQVTELLEKIKEVDEE